MSPCKALTHACSNDWKGKVKSEANIRKEKKVDVTSMGWEQDDGISLKAVLDLKVDI